MKIKISHLIKTTAILTGLGFLFLAESAEAQIRYSRQSNVPDFRFSIFETPDASTSDTEGRFNGAIKNIFYDDDCSFKTTTIPGYLCSGEFPFYNFTIGGRGVPQVQANLLASLSGDVVKYTFKIDSPFMATTFFNGNYINITLSSNNFYQFEVNVAANGLDSIKAVNDINYIIDNNVLALVDFNSEMLNVVQDNGTVIKLAPPSTDSMNSVCINDDGTEGQLIPRGQNDNGDLVGICVFSAPRGVVIPEPNPLAGLLVLANSPILALLWRFLKTK